MSWQCDVALQPWHVIIIILDHVCRYDRDEDCILKGIYADERQHEWEGTVPSQVIYQSSLFLYWLNNLHSKTHKEIWAIYHLRKHVVKWTNQMDEGMMNLSISNSIISPLAQEFSFQNTQATLSNLSPKETSGKVDIHWWMGAHASLQFVHFIEIFHGWRTT